MAKNITKNITASLDPWQRHARVMEYWGRRADALERRIQEMAGDEPIAEGKILEALAQAHERCLAAARELMPYLRPKLSAAKVTLSERIDPSTRRLIEQSVEDDDAVRH